MLATVVAVALTVSPVEAAQSGYFRRSKSDLNPNVMLIDEKKHLGSQITSGTRLIDQNGRAFTWGDMLGKPTILVLAYYTCDGSCSIINQTLADLLKDVNAVKPGEDFRILTLSFDRHDNLAATSAFRSHVTMSREAGDAWTFGTFASEDELKTETERIGFKFFWSPADRIFLHPGAFLFFSPEGKLVRVLYQQEVDARDVELAVLDAKQTNFRPSEIINLALSVCYSYNYADGKYRLNISLFVGLGALIGGLMLFVTSIVIFKTRRQKQLLVGGNHAEVA